MLQSAVDLLNKRRKSFENTFYRGEETMSLKGITGVCLKGALVALAAMTFAWSIPAAHAGAIRSAGRMVAKGTAVAAAATVSGSQAAANKIQTDAVPATANAGHSVKRTLVHAGH